MNKKNIISVIKYEGPNDVFVWKHSIEDFNLGTQLIVHESQEAIFFRDGEALDLFGAGRHTLTTQNIPIIGSKYKEVANDNAFHCEVYFINQTTQMGVKWGTDSKIRMFDPISGLHVSIGASGTFNIRVDNSRKLIVKLVGTEKEFLQKDIIGIDSSHQYSLGGKFKSLVITKVKTHLAKIIKERNINILEVDEHLEDLSKTLRNEINVTMKEYGLTLPEFYVQNIITPDDDPNFRKLKEQHAERYLRVKQEEILKEEALAAQQRKIIESQTLAQQKIIASQADAEAHILKSTAEAREMQLKGYTYQQETQRIVASKAADNPSSGGTASGIGKELVGLGVGLGVVGQVVGAVKEETGAIIPKAVEAGKSVATDNNQRICPSCNYANSITDRFCQNCGEQLIKVNKCSECGADLNANAKFCSNCGKKVGE